MLMSQLIEKYYVLYMCVYIYVHVLKLYLFIQVILEMKREFLEM